LDEPEHIGCLRSRLIGTVASPGSYEIQVMHVTCIHEPTAFGGIGLHVVRDFSEDPDDTSDDTPDRSPDDAADATPDDAADATTDRSPDDAADATPDRSPDDAADDSPDDSSGNGISVLMSIGSALVLANRIQAAVNAALTVGEGPIDADRAIAQMLASETD
jgi:hypothetical protein